MTPLTDLSLMPFGHHKGKPMQDVPVDYLHFLWHKCNFKDKVYKSDVATYIHENMSALKMENEDLLW